MKKVRERSGKTIEPYLTRKQSAISVYIGTHKAHRFVPAIPRKPRTNDQILKIMQIKGSEQPTYVL